MTVLITGGASYTGSPIVRLVSDRGERVIAAGNCKPGYVYRLGAIDVLGLALSVGLLRKRIREHDVVSVIQRAALQNDDDSVDRPLRYFQQPTTGRAGNPNRRHGANEK